MNQNESAFPIIGEKVSTRYGLTKLEYFSIKCLQGLLSNSHITETKFQQRIINDSIEYAKELLKQLENESNN
jgi:hypothetical protein